MVSLIILNCRLIKADFHGNSFNTKEYNDINGVGAAERVIAALRTIKEKKSLQKKFGRFFMKHIYLIKAHLNSSIIKSQLIAKLLHTILSLQLCKEVMFNIRLKKQDKVQ